VTFFDVIDLVPDDSPAHVAWTAATGHWDWLNAIVGSVDAQDERVRLSGVGVVSDAHIAPLGAQSVTVETVGHSGRKGRLQGEGTELGPACG
jgi:hypothetical protein